MECNILINSYRKQKNVLESPLKISKTSLLKGYFSTETEIQQIASYSNDVSTELYSWLAEKLQGNRVTDLKELILKLEIIKQRITTQNSFTILLSLLMSTFTAFTTMIIKSQSLTVDAFGVAITGAFILFSLIKRGDYMKYLTHCEDLEILISKLIDTKDT